MFLQYAYSIAEFQVLFLCEEIGYEHRHVFDKRAHDLRTLVVQLFPLCMVEVERMWLRGFGVAVSRGATLSALVDRHKYRCSRCCSEPSLG